MNTTRYGIAYFRNDAHPAEPNAEVIGWKQRNGRDIVWEDRDDALEANDLDGWRGYVCQYPSGKQ